MCLRLPVVMLLAALLSGPVSAIGENTTERLREFALDRVYDGQRLVLGPSEIALPAIDPNSSCIELYQRRVKLWHQVHDYKPAYWNDPRNQAAVFLGTIWSPAFYFLGFSAVTAHLDQLNDAAPLAEIDALSRASAQLRCFEK